MRTFIKMLLISMIFAGLTGCLAGTNKTSEEPVVATAGATESFEDSYLTLNLMILQFPTS